MIEQKRQIRSRLEIIKINTERIIGAAKKDRSGIKFTTVAEIEKEISRLQHKQETSSMSLADEKKLIKEIEALQASKRTAAELQAKQGDLNSMKLDRKSVSADLTAKDKEIDAIQKEIDAQAKVVKELQDTHSSHRGAVDELIKQRDALKEKLDEKFKEKGELKTEFREKTNEWYQAGRAIKAQKQLQYEEDKKKNEEEHQAWLKKKEEEELKKTPYEEEMTLCEYLTDYLTKTYLTDHADEAEKKAKAAEEKAKADVVAVKDDPFAGFKAMGKDFGKQLDVHRHADASAAIGIAQRKGLGKLRHLDTQALWIQDALRTRRVIVEKVFGTENPADLMTKHLDGPDLHKCLKKLGIHIRKGRAEAAPSLVKKAEAHAVEPADITAHLNRQVAADKVRPSSAPTHIGFLTKGSSWADEDVCS